MKPIRLALVLAGMAVLAGCATSATPRYDSAFGESVRQARALHVINPEAGRNTDPVTGIDARAGRASYERYQDSFRAPPSTFEVLGIGGSTLGSGSGQ